MASPVDNNYIISKIMSEGEDFQPKTEGEFRAFMNLVEKVRENNPELPSSQYLSFIVKQIRSGRPIGVPKSKEMKMLQELEKYKKSSMTPRERLLDDLISTVLSKDKPFTEDMVDPLPSAIMADAYADELAAVTGVPASRSVQPAAAKARPGSVDDMIMKLATLSTPRSSSLAELARALRPPPPPKPPKPPKYNPNIDKQIAKLEEEIKKEQIEQAERVAKQMAKKDFIDQKIDESEVESATQKYFEEIIRKEGL